MDGIACIHSVQTSAPSRAMTSAADFFRALTQKHCSHCVPSEEVLRRRAMARTLQTLRKDNAETTLDQMPQAKTTTRSETIRQKLADDILHGVYPPGAKLDEKQLAERFKLSRTPVREALRQLISAGLIELRPHRGAVVSLPSEAALAEMFEVMGELEASCARLAAQRIAPSERARLEAVHRDCADAVHAGDRDRYRSLNFNFHDLVYRACHNDFLATTAQAVRQRIAPFRRAQFEISDRMAKSHSEHESIVLAIMAGDGDTASNVMRTHVSVVRAATREYVRGLEAAGRLNETRRALSRRFRVPSQEKPSSTAGTNPTEMRSGSE